MCHVVQVLDAHYLRNCLSFHQLVRTDIAQTEMTNQSMALKFGKHGQRFFDRPLRWTHYASDPKVDDIKAVDSEISEIVMNGID